MQKLETKLANKFILELRKSCTKQHERIELFKIHGGDYQERNLPDWIGCYRGRFIAMEFKVHPNEADRAQLDKLIEIIDAGGIAMIVEFVTAEPLEYTIDQAYMILLTAFHQNMKHMLFHVHYRPTEWN